MVTRIRLEFANSPSATGACVGLDLDLFADPTGGAVGDFWALAGPIGDTLSAEDNLSHALTLQRLPPPTRLRWLS